MVDLSRMFKLITGFLIAAVMILCAIIMGYLDVSDKAIALMDNLPDEIKSVEIPDIAE